MATALSWTAPVLEAKASTCKHTARGNAPRLPDMATQVARGMEMERPLISHFKSKAIEEALAGYPTLPTRIHFPSPFPPLVLRPLATRHTRADLRP